MKEDLPWIKKQPPKEKRKEKKSQFSPDSQLLRKFSEKKWNAHSGQFYVAFKWKSSATKYDSQFWIKTLCEMKLLTVYG